MTPPPPGGHEHRPSPPEGSARRSPAYLGLYALAYGGGVIAYVPVLVFLLPLKVGLIAPDDRVAVLSQAAFWGAVAASFANLLVGMLTDRSARRGGSRRPWLAVGVAATLASYAGLWAAGTPAQLIAAVTAFQVGLNFIIAPLTAIAADEVPDEQKGVLGGLLGATQPAGHLIGAAAVIDPSLPEGARLLFVGAVLTFAIAPFLLRSKPAGAKPPAAALKADGAFETGAGLALVWIARFLVQVAGACLFTYLFFFFEARADGAGQAEVAADVARLSGVVMALAAAASLAAGWLSDRFRARRPILALTAAASGAGLLVMAMQSTWSAAAVGYGVFSCASAVFLALSSTYAMQLLPSPLHRGRDLGVVNLTNTLPSMAAPPLAYAAIASGGYEALLLGLAVLATAGAVLILLQGTIAATARPRLQS